MTKQSHLDGPVERRLCRCGHRHWLHHKGWSSHAPTPGCDVLNCTCKGYHAARKR